MLSSPAGSQASNTASSVELTPHRRIQALLANLSDSDDDITVLQKQRASLQTRGRSVSPESSSVAGASDTERTYNVRSPPDSSNVPRVRRRLLGQILRNDDTETTEIYRQHDISPTVDSPLSHKSNSPAGSKRKFTEYNASPAQSAHTDQKSRFQALVEKQRKLRLEREEAERAKQEVRKARLAEEAEKARAARTSSPDASSGEDSDASIREAAKKLTRNARPTRKASRKAVEEMNRETQRMNRNMQLAHQARTKKKFAKEDLLAKFAFTTTSRAEQPMDSSSAAFSEDEKISTSTPATSPLASPGVHKEVAGVATQSGEKETRSIAEPQTLEEMIAARRSEVDTAKSVPKSLKRTIGSRVTRFNTLLDSDSDLDVVDDKASRRKYAVFENVPAKKASETISHLTLRALASVASGKSSKTGASSAAVNVKLRLAARNQAREERQEKIEKLKAKGIIIQTAEEKERDQQEIEDLVDKARAEADEIRQREHAKAKKDGTLTTDALDELDESDEDDEEYEDDMDDAQSGSEEENDATEQLNETVNADQFVEDAAAESESAEDINELVSADGSSEDEHNNTLTDASRHISRAKRIVDDDDEEEDVKTPQKLPPAVFLTSKTPVTVRQSTRKIIPGLQHSDDLPIGLTQAFAATMADAQTQSQEPGSAMENIIQESQHEASMNNMSVLTRGGSLDLIAESPISSPGNITAQVPFTIDSPALTKLTNATQPGFEPTQDDGYHYSPFRGDRFADTPNRDPYSTENTVILNVTESPILQRKRLQRGHVEQDESRSERDDDAFAALRRAARVQEQAAFSKKRSEARAAVDEAAEESDDEYAGLGGVSDEDSDEEATEQDRAMVDDETTISKSDEAKLAGLHAERERATDEAAVSKLLKDITTGALRRKRGAGDELDLSDEEDEAARRRDSKRREFAKMRRELLKDEAVGRIADDTKKEAFLRSIEDREAIDDEFVELDQPEPQESQSQSQIQQPMSETTLQPISPAKLNQRRTDASVIKPTTLAQIRDTVSFLIEEPDSQSALVDLDYSDSETEPETYVNLDRHVRQASADIDALLDEDGEDLADLIDDSETTTHSRPPYSARRTGRPVIDRLSLSRQTTAAVGTRLAFQRVPSMSVPSLLRRATANSSITSLSSALVVSATGVVTAKTERASSSDARKEYIRKAAGTSRNAVNYSVKQTLRDEKVASREMSTKRRKTGGGLLGGLFRSDTWA